MATPELAAKTYKRLLHPITGVAPTSKRILEDVSGVWLAMNIVCEQKGVYVPGLAERSGRRYIKGSEKKRAVEAHVRKVSILLPIRRERQGCMPTSRACGQRKGK